MQLKSLNNSEDSAYNLDAVLNEIKRISKQFDEQTVNEMSKEFISLIRNIETISFTQEEIINKSESMNQYNPAWKEIAYNQNLIQNKVVKFIEQLLALNNKTLHIPPSINKTIGSVQLSIQKSIASIEQTRTSKARKESKNALSAINETAYILISSLNKMQESMSASGIESYLEQLEQMSKEQKEINQGTGQCMMPGGSVPGEMGMQDALMRRLQSQQKKLQEQLGELLSDNPGQDQSGLSKSFQDMEEVINDFKQSKVDRETINRQQAILSRMLDSQKSLKKKDYSNKRKSKVSDLKFEKDLGLVIPEDYGNRETMLTKALNDALDHGYSTDYQRSY